jgi:hypothetical protein
MDKTFVFDIASIIFELVMGLPVLYSSRHFFFDDRLGRIERYDLSKYFSCQKITGEESSHSSF